VRRSEPGSATYDEREAANGITTTELLKAVVWCEEPAIREALFGIFQLTDDAEILVAILPSVQKWHPELIVPRLQAMLKMLPATEDSPRGQAFELLVALGRSLGREARPEFERYLKEADLQRRAAICSVLSTTKPEWAIDLLIPLLGDKRI
jgi:hypothetical protein